MAEIKLNDEWRIKNQIYTIFLENWKQYKFGAPGGIWTRDPRLSFPRYKAVALTAKPPGLKRPASIDLRKKLISFAESNFSRSALKIYSKQQSL